MRATKAYIASLGTTGVMLGAAILMLAVVSAVVAFDRWPGANPTAPIKTLVLAERPAPIRVTSRSTAPAATPARRPARTPTTAPARNRPGSGAAPTAGGVRGGSRGTTAPGAVATPALPPPVQKTLQPVQAATTPIIDVVSNPGTTAGVVAAGTQSLTSTAGAAVGQLSPQIGAIVTQAGDALAQTVGSVPLPDHVLPGH